MPEAMMVAIQLNRESDLHIHHVFFSMPVSRDPMLPMKVQWTLGFIHIEAVLGFFLAVNEKTQRCYTQLPTSKRS